MSNLKDALNITLNRILNENEKEIKKYDKELERLMAVTDSALDKPLYDNPKYACGDCLEGLRNYLQTLSKNMQSLRSHVMAISLAYHYADNYPSLSKEERESIIDGYIYGYLDATEE